MKESKWRWAIFGLVSLILVGSDGAGAEKAGAKLAPAEIRQYQGQDLSSVNDFRENSIAGPQAISLNRYRLKIGGRVEHTLALTSAQVLSEKHYSKVVTLYCVEGWDVRILWEGVLLDDLLAKAGVKHDAVTVIFHAADGWLYLVSAFGVYSRKKNPAGLQDERADTFCRTGVSLSGRGRV